MSQTYKINVVNRTGYAINNIILHHASSETATEGTLVLSLPDVMESGKYNDYVNFDIDDGTWDYWYLTCNILVPMSELPGLKPEELNPEVELINDCMPIMMANSKGWKECVLVASTDHGATFYLTLNGNFAGPTDIKFDLKIGPFPHSGDVQASSGTESWLEPMGHGGEIPVFALAYPAGATLAGLVAAGGWLCFGTAILAACTEEASESAIYMEEVYSSNADLVYSDPPPNIVEITLDG